MTFSGLFEIGDRVWERMKRRSRRFQLADQTDDQSHTHHALVTVLLFGSIGAGAALLLQAPIEFGLRVGFVLGWLFYVIREVVARVMLGWHYKPWDGIGDVLEPIVWTAPVTFGSAKLLWGLAAIFAIYFFVFRPLSASDP